MHQKPQQKVGATVRDPKSASGAQILDPHPYLWVFNLFQPYFVHTNFGEIKKNRPNSLSHRHPFQIPQKHFCIPPIWYNTYIVPWLGTINFTPVCSERVSRKRPTDLSFWEPFGNMVTDLFSKKTWKERFCVLLARVEWKVVVEKTVKFPQLINVL